MPSKSVLPGCLLVLIPILFFGAVTQAGEMDCATCHSNLKKQKVVHPALEMGCPSCHTAIDATAVPHKKGTDARVCPLRSPISATDATTRRCSRRRTCTLR